MSHIEMKKYLVACDICKISEITEEQPKHIFNMVKYPSGWRSVFYRTPQRGRFITDRSVDACPMCVDKIELPEDAKDIRTTDH